MLQILFQAVYQTIPEMFEDSQHDHYLVSRNNRQAMEQIMEGKQIWVMLLGIVLGVWGCAGSAAQLPPRKVVAQVDAQA